MRGIPFFAFLLAGCSSMTLNPPYAESPADTDRVVQAAQRVFHAYEIPVEPYRGGTGRLDSGTFVVEGSWGGEPIETRVDCGWEDGRPLANQGAVMIDVRMQARPRRDMTRIRVDGRGTLAFRSEEVSCTLTREFSQRLADEISGQSGGAGPGMPVRGVRGARAGQGVGPPLRGADGDTGSGA